MEIEEALALLNSFNEEAKKIINMLEELEQQIKAEINQ